MRADEHGERIPLTISDFDAAEGRVTIVTQAIGASTRKICALNEGDALADFAGPLGHPSEFVKMPVEELRKRRYLFVAGGVGTAPVYPQVKWLRKHGVKADVIIGAKTRDMLIYTDAMRARSRKPPHRHRRRFGGFQGTRDGADRGTDRKRGQTLRRMRGHRPMIMMKFVALTTKKYALKTTVSLNALMVDGTGMCGRLPRDGRRQDAFHLRRRPRVRRPRGRFRRSHAPAGHVPHAGTARRGHRGRTRCRAPM